MRRTPGLGNDVFVNLWIDGVPVRGMGYGQSYEGFLRPGPHTVAVMVSPKPIDKDPWKMTLDVKAGATYSFTAASYAGHLVLKPNR
ncbi:MAG: hypothetical protein JWO45_514 [Spartobacteria bacterium]|nr:hypothetical protein [Spartobacteria bacterium]